MVRHVKCILLLEWSTTSQRLWVYRISVPYAQKRSQIPIRKEKGATLGILVEGGTIPEDFVQENIK